MVVEDSSPDGTLEVAEQLQVRHTVAESVMSSLHPSPRLAYRAPSPLLLFPRRVNKTAALHVCCTVVVAGTDALLLTRSLRSTSGQVVCWHPLG